MEFFSVKQIAEQRGVSERAIYKQIQSHKEELKGHSTKREGKLWYDQDAVKILENSAINSAPVIVETKQKQEVEELKAEIKKLKDQHDQDHIQITETLAAMTSLVKQHDDDAKLIAESKLYIEQKDRAEEKITVLEGQIAELQAELEQEKHKTWWQKLRGK